MIITSLVRFCDGLKACLRPTVTKYHHSRHSRSVEECLVLFGGSADTGAEVQESRNAVASLKDAEQRPAVLNEAMQDIQQATRTGSAAQPRGG